MDAEEDPINLIGFGYVSFFGLLKQLIWMMLILTVLSTPLFQLLFENQKVESEYGGLTVGNLGMSDTFCHELHLSGKGIGLSCTDGVIAEFTHFGVYNRRSEAAQESICQTGLGLDTGIQGCEILSSKESLLYKEQLLPCIGHASCFIEHPLKSMPTASQRLDYPPECSVPKNTTVLFVQYECRVSTERMNLKQLIGGYSGCVSVFSVFYLIALTRFIVKSAKYQKKIYDLETVTVEDYTLTCELTNEDLEPAGEENQLVDLGPRSDLEQRDPTTEVF